MTQTVCQAFSAAAMRYDQAAYIQRQAAHQFAAWLSAQTLKQPQQIIEIGCGTGFLTAQLVQLYPQAQILATDIAPTMLAQAQKKLSTTASYPNLHWQVLDAQHGMPYASDWLVSALCLQWLDPLAETLHKLWQSTEVLAFSIVLADSFTDWQAAHTKLKLATGLQQLPSWEYLQTICSALHPAALYSKRIRLSETHADAHSFVHSIKAIGAHVPRTGHTWSGLRSPLRQVLRALPQPCTMNYEIGFFCLVKALTAASNN